jgi:nicotinic acid mononucleotide adenylyltransferase
MNIAKIGAEYIARQHPDKKIHLYFVPVNDYYEKASVKCVKFSDRFKMLKIAADALNEEGSKITFDVSDIEAVEGETTNQSVKTWRSLELLINEHHANPENVYLMQGQDNIAGILKGSWEKPYDLIFKSKLLCIPREGAPLLSQMIYLDTLKNKDSQFNYKTKEAIMERVKIIDTIPSLISSSELREEIRKLLKIAHPEILKYIWNNKLYKELKCEAPPKGGGRRKLRKTRRSSVRRGKKTRRH